jgi:hypothetical protein
MLILSELDFDIEFPNMFRFYQMFCKKVKATSIHQLFGNFLLEITMLENRILSSNKLSLIALAALNLVS